MGEAHFDVVIVGAGLSGVGAACHLLRECPGTTFAVLETRDAVGGTWDLFRFPGVRSDSDMFTLAYSFRPWTGVESMPRGDAIRRYIEDTADEYGVTERIRFGHHVARAAWSSDDARWRVEAEHDGATVELTCAFLFCCTGYYRYDEGYTPPLPGIDEFSGAVVHPQRWPADLDHTGKRVVVIGSGATAMTIVPVMADSAAHVTMLQRSPTYVLSLPQRDVVTEGLRRVLPRRPADRAIRAKNTVVQTLMYQFSRRAPERMKDLLHKGVAANLPEGFEIGDAFTPSYAPWDQRLCFVPDADLFRAIGDGRASVVTAEIDRITPSGVLLQSGEALEADIIVTATGLNLLAIGGIDVEVDGRGVEVSSAVAYRAMMLSGVPNFAFVMGYTNASWTLKADLVARFVCRLVNRMRERGERSVTPTLPDAPLDTAPVFGLQAGYVRRGLDQIPRQGNRGAWRAHQNWFRDVPGYRFGRLDDDALQFSG